jgi:hypothetical protein
VGVVVDRIGERIHRGGNAIPGGRLSCAELDERIGRGILDDHDYATMMRSYLAAWGDREAYAVSHVGFGMNPGARYEALAIPPGISICP